MHVVVVAHYDLTLSLITSLCVLSQANDFAQITSFGLTEGSGDLGERLTFECTASGDPRPLVSLWKSDLYNWGSSDSFYTESGHDYLSNMVIKTARCIDNGIYQCRAENTYRGSPYRDTAELEFSVRCPPSSCDGTDVPQKFAVEPGDDVTINVCAIGYPSVSASTFHLERETENGWSDHPNAVVELVGWATTLIGLSITFQPLNVGDLGNFRAVYEPGGNDSNSNIYFQLTEKSDTALSTEAIIGISLAGFVVLTLAVILGIYCCARKKQLEKVSQQPEQNGDVNDNDTQTTIKGDEIITTEDRFWWWR